MDNSKTFWLPEKASTFVDIVDPAFNLFYWISVFFFVLICGLILVFTVKYIRRRPDQLASAQITHNLPLELSWTIIPLIIVMILFFIGMKGYLHMRVPPADSIQVNVMGQKWSWSFTYGTGAINDTLVVPVNTPVKLLMTSRDVLHSFFIPAFRTKADVIPNRYHSLWFQATRTGVFPVQCTQYCGTNHSYMLTAVKVLEQDAYDDWLANASDPGKGKTPAEFGAILYSKRGCNACHSLDGTKVVGPTWKGIFGKMESMATGPAMKVDEAYLRQSILEPNAHVVAGFQPVMPTYKGVLNDREVDALIEYIKTLK
jgi:cytochrome c oxidase subunit 2